MKIGNEFCNLMRSLVAQGDSEAYRQQSQRKDEILKDFSHRGFEIPPGSLYGALYQLQVNAIRQKQDVVCDALKETLDAFDPPFYPDLATDIYSLVESFFPASLCEPRDPLRSAGWKRPFAENTDQRLRYNLESARRIALNTLRTKIDLYVAKKRSKMNETGTSTKLPEVITVLFIASNPMDQSQLRLDEEIRSITKKIRESEYRDVLELKSVWAARPTDLLQAINEHKPTIVHFSGHGSCNDELVLQDDLGGTKPVSLRSIVEMFKVVDSGIKLVVFNTCYSENQASEIVEHVSAAIGMTTSIGDDAARIFSAQLYSAIGFGKNIEQSFGQAKAALMLENIPEEQTPKLFLHKNTNGNDLVFVKPDST